MDQSPTGTTHPTQPRLRLATAPVNWNNNDVPNWRPLTPFPEILDHMASAGYRATEYDASFGTDPAVLNREASTRGIAWCGAYQWVDFLDADHLPAAIERLTPTMELLRAIGCENLIVADSLRPHRVDIAGRVAPDGSESLSDEQVQTIAEGVHHLANVARSLGLAVHFHNHVGTWIETPAEVNALLDHLDTGLATLCFDTGHYAYGGGDAASFIDQHIEKIGYLHLKDVDTNVIKDARRRELSFIDALREIVFSPIGTGEADIPAILRQLVSSTFDGWVVIEQDTCAGDPTETAKQNLRFITDWLSEHPAPSTTR